MGPAVLLDKSVLVSLSADEIRLLCRYFYIIIPPVTMFELLSEAGKNRDDAMRRLAGQSDKLCMDYIDQEDYCYLVFHSFMGSHIEMDGRPIKPGGKRVQAKDGSIGYMWDVSEVNKKLLRWRVGEPSETEVEQAKEWQRLKAADHMKEFKCRITKALPTHSIDTVEKAFSAAQGLLYRDEPDMKQAAVDIVIGLSGVNERGRTDAINRWLELSMPRLIDIAPYAAYAFTLFAAFYTGTACNLIPISKKDSAQIDWQYLFYLPFCKAFFSNDGIHERWAPVIGRTVDCEFVSGDKVRAELGTIAKALMDGHPRSAESGIDSPPQFEGSILNKIWGKVCRR
jgi:hypothetical protein